VSDAITLAKAAFFTDLLIEYATSPRQAMTQKARKPSTAPTMINTVPSGREDFCMNGASAVYGTTIVGIPAPATVGAAVRENSELAAVPVEGTADEALVVVAAELADDEVAFVLLADVDEALELDEDLDVCVAVLRFGRLESWASTEVANRSTSRPAAAVLARPCARIFLDRMASLQMPSIVVLRSLIERRACDVKVWCVRRRFRRRSFVVVGVSFP